ncbi:prothymosin alpha-like [Cavia porcellus]|uniref:prothymosin alpha-like n=1 Tax=Cavia porcellus TaxID=10141 RepID=UPI00022B74D1|nr:prothymosin alpha-like [Cavia porcellus]
MSHQVRRGLDTSSQITTEDLKMVEEAENGRDTRQREQERGEWQMRACNEVEEEEEEAREEEENRDEEEEEEAEAATSNREAEDNKDDQVDTKKQKIGRMTRQQTGKIIKRPP